MEEKNDLDAINPCQPGCGGLFIQTVLVLLIMRMQL